ncbi:MAG TPA: TolC family protein [Terriglobales bacterium]|jgi:outer membrane protein TolC|nr:TolC family protein [Terriglobales bacterium]
MDKKRSLPRRLAGFLAALALAAPAVASGPRDAAAPAQAPAPAETTVTLDELVREALARNPAVQAAEHQVAAGRARVPQARALPDPKLSVGWEGNIAPFSVQAGDPASYRSVSAMQEVPYPGKLKLRGEIAGSEVSAEEADAEAVRRRVTAEVKAAYYEYFFAQKATEITLKNKDLLEKLAKIAEVRYQVGKGLQADVLRAQTETSLLEQRLTLLDAQKKVAQARLNALLFRDPEAPLPPAAGFEPSKLEYSLAALDQMARQNDPGLDREGRHIERSQFALALARKDAYPDLSVGYMYQQRPLIPDMHGFTFTLSIPVFYKSKQKQAIREASEDLAGAQRARDGRQADLAFELRQQYLAAKASENLMRLYSQAIVPQSSLALESAMAAYQVGNLDFLSLMGNFTTVLDYRVGYYRELVNYQIALARMEPMVGTELTK